MAFFQNAYSTRAYEVAAIGDSTTSLSVGTAVSLKKLPVGLSAPDFYYQVAAAKSTDEVFGVVSAQSVAINNTTPGRIVLTNSALIPVLTSGVALRGDYIKVQATDGQMDKVAMGEVASAQLVEDSTKGSLAWARPVKYKP